MPTLMTRLEEVKTPPPPVPPSGFGAESNAATSSRPSGEGGRDSATILGVVSALLAIPGLYFAIFGWFLVIPPLVFILGFLLLIGYFRSAFDCRPLPGTLFWSASALYNAAGFVIYGLISVNAGEISPVILLSLWCGIALVLSLVACREAAILRRREARPKQTLTTAPPLQHSVA